jgi:hypothetical protein
VGVGQSLLTLFSTLRLWDHRDRIVSGELAELAPLLVLCEQSPTEQTLHQESQLIHGSGLPREVKAALSGIAILVASRRFARTILEAIFREDLEMVEPMENLRDLFLEVGALEKWVEDTGIAARIRNEAEVRSEARGKAEVAREMVLHYLTARFGQLPDDLVAQISSADAEWCQRLFDRALLTQSLAELLAPPQN